MSDVIAHMSKGDRMCQQLARNWWLIALRGVLAIAFGIIALTAPGATLLSLALIFAIYLIIDGVVGVASAVRAARRDERWGWLLTEAVLSLLMGVIALVMPGAAILTFVIITAVWALLSGVTSLVAGFRLTHTHGRWWMILGGVVSVLFGIALLGAPLVGALVLTWWLGAYAIAFGVMLLVLAFKLRASRDQTPQSGAAQAA